MTKPAVAAPPLNPSSRRIALVSVALLAICVGIAGAQASGQDRRSLRTGNQGEVAHLRCGKARALVPQWRKMMRARAGHAGIGPDLLPGGDRALGGATAEPVVPSDTDLLHCSVEIEAVPDQYVNLIGTNTMTIQSKRGSLAEFVFRLRDQFDITDANINGTPVTVTTLSGSTRLVTLDRIYGYDEVFDLTIAYQGHAVSAGFGSIEFSTHNGSEIVYTLSEPYYSYTWLPIKDGDVAQPGDNDDKFTLDMAVIAPSGMVTASNGLLQGIDDLSGNRRRYRWSSSYQIAPYLACFSSTNYNTWSVPYVALDGSTMPVDFYIYPESDNSGNRAAWEAVVDTMYIFRNLYGEYPFVNEKYGIYQCNFGGGMEHQTFTAQGGFWDWVTVHELAHQWWGDAVTCRKWNDIWLNEGFATYGEALWAENRPGGGQSALESYMAGLKYTGGGSVYVWDSELGSLWDIFDGATSYNKGGWVLHMLRHVMGDADFFAALGAYRGKYEGHGATTDDFQQVFESFYGDSLDWFFQEWVYGEYAPAYEYGWTSSQVNGKDYLLLLVDQTQSNSYQRFTMPIDLLVDGQTYVVQNDEDREHFVVALPGPPSSVQFDPHSWIMWSTRTQTGYVAGPPTVVETSPAPGAVLMHSSSPDRVIVRFHTGVDVDAADFDLVGEKGGAIGFSVTPSSNVDTVELVLTKPPLRPDRYTLTIHDSITATGSGLALDGEVLDPEDPSSLPSGEGLAGGTAEVRFTISGGRDTSG